MLGKQMSYRVFVVSLAACPMVVLACGGDDDGRSSSANATSGSGGSSTATNGGGSGGTAPNSTSSGGSGTSGSGGASSTGTGGSNTGGTAGSGGSGTGGSSTGGTGTGGTGGSGTGGTTATGGSGGTGAEGGMAGEAGMGGEGGAPPAVNLLTNGDFNAFMDGWQNDPADPVYAKAEYQWGQQGISHWYGSEYAVSTYQTIEDVPDGTYSFSIYAISGGGFDEQYLFARGYDANDENAEMTQSLASVPNTGPYSQDNLVTLSGIVVTSGTVTVGFHSDSDETAADSWANFDDAVFIRE